MAVKLRLVRMGKKKQPTYRLVAADSRAPRDGRFLEVVGTYAPRGRSVTDREPIVSIDTEAAQRWIAQGAQPTERAARLLRDAGLAAVPGRIPTPKTKAVPPVKEVPPAPAPAAPLVEASTSEPADAAGDAPAPAPTEETTEETGE